LVETEHCSLETFEILRERYKGERFENSKKVNGASSGPLSSAVLINMNNKLAPG